MLKLENAIEVITESSATELCRNMTGYKGVKDWASDTWESYSDLVQTISAICFVGSGLTYTTIFSATRGNIGLMSWAFSFFIVGLIITITVQAFLVQCSRLENYPFSTQGLWELVLGVFVYSAILAVVAAMCLLLFTIRELPIGHDQLPTFGVSSYPPAVLGLSAIGIGMLVASVVVGVFALANGIKALLWRRRILRKKENLRSKKLDELKGL